MESVADAKGSFKDSLWTRMVGEVVAFSQRAPCYLLTGLTLLCELLPLPLPIAAGNCYQSPSMDVLLEHRIRWSGHLAPLEYELTRGPLRAAAGAVTPALAAVGRRLFAQLTDLGPHIARMVVRSFLSQLVKYLPPVGGEEELIPVADYAAIATHVGLLAQLTQIPSFKATLVNVLESPDYEPVVEKLEKTFEHIAAGVTTHIVFQENTIAFFLALVTRVACLDAERKDAQPSDLIPFEKGSDSCVRLILPNRVLAKKALASLLEHLGKAANGYATVIPCLRAIVTLIQGAGKAYLLPAFCEVLIEDEQQKGSLVRLAERLVEEGNGDSSDGLSTLSGLVDILTAICSYPASCQAAIVALDWKAESTADHSLIRLQQLRGNDDAVCQALTRVIHSLNAAMVDDHGKATETAYSWWPKDGRSLEEQFETRLVVTVLPENQPPDQQHQFLCRSYWLPTCTTADEAVDSDRIAASDLESIRAECLPQHDPKAELIRRIAARLVDRPKFTKEKRFTRPGIINTAKGEMKKEPLRGRGFHLRGLPSGGVGVNGVGGGVGGSGSNPTDTFRARPQNTSRAPSMHVDDFILAQAKVQKERDQRSEMGKVAKEREQSRQRSESRKPDRIIAPTSGAPSPSPSSSSLARDGESRRHHRHHSIEPSSSSSMTQEGHRDPAAATGIRSPGRSGTPSSNRSGGGGGGSTRPTAGRANESCSVRGDGNTDRPNRTMDEARRRVSSPDRHRRPPPPSLSGRRGSGGGRPFPGSGAFRGRRPVMERNAPPPPSWSQRRQIETSFRHHQQQQQQQQRRPPPHPRRDTRPISSPSKKRSHHDERRRK